MKTLPQRGTGHGSFLLLSVIMVLYERGTMEFDNNTPVSDEQRRLAESKKITVNPVHSDIQPEELSASEIAAHHLNAPAIANIENDTEQNKASVQPSTGLLKQSETRTGSGFTIAIVAAATLSALAIGVFFFFK